ncbi:MAG: threonine/serine exporter family protein [Clostridium sp.]|mgnify:FL=1
MDVNKLLQVSAFAGQILLESGAETYRVEETIDKICLAFGVKETDSFATPTGIIVSITYKEQIYSTVKRITNRGVDLNKVDKINDLSRRLQNKPMYLDELYKTLLKINKGDNYKTLYSYLASSLVAGAFSLLYGGDFNDFISSFIIGFGINYIILKSKKFLLNSFFTNCVGGGFTALLALIFKYFGLVHNLDKTIIGSIMLLVPGIIITNAVRDIIAGDYLAGITRGSEAFLIAVAIAVGTGVVISLWIKVLGGTI